MESKKYNLSEKYILDNLNKKKDCSIATINNSGTNLDNALVSYYFEEFKLYFGAFDYTLKCKNIKTNPYVAITIDKVQIHGICIKIAKNSDEYKNILRKYLNKFPNYRSFSQCNNNDLYRVDPLVYWIYNYKLGAMYREKIIFNTEYYKALNTYDIEQREQIKFY